MSELLPPEPKLYTPDEAQRLLRIGKTMFYSLVNSGRLPTSKIGRSTVVRRDDLEKLIEASRHDPL